jgi:hypothetical protein
MPALYSLHICTSMAKAIIAMLACNYTNSSHEANLPYAWNFLNSSLNTTIQGA